MADNFDFKDYVSVCSLRCHDDTYPDGKYDIGICVNGSNANFWTRLEWAWSFLFQKEFNFVIGVKDVPDFMSAVFSAYNNHDDEDTEEY